MEEKNLRIKGKIQKKYVNGEKLYEKMENNFKKKSGWQKTIPDKKEKNSKHLEKKS